MARIARDSTPKRRSARLSNNEQSTKKTPASNLKLDAVLERDETPDALASLDSLVATPSRNLQDRFNALSKVTTPKTETKPDNGQMHPVTVHPTTTKAPDSGLKLGFADISTTGKASLASLQNTPSRPRQSLASTNIPSAYQFQFNHESKMSEEGRQLMHSIRKDVAGIKEQMRIEKETQDQKDAEADNMLVDATGRKIAKPTAKSGRYSEVHMAEFKKMDSIANHPSSFRSRPGFARPTTQSLKRSSSKADLDDLERPKTAGKSPVTRIPPPVSGRLASTSPFKSIPQVEQHAKRMRQEDDQDVSSSRPTTIPQPVSSRLLSPTKASAARTNSSPGKTGIPARSNSVKSIRSVSRPPTAVNASPLKVPQLDKPLPPTPQAQPSSNFFEQVSPTREPKSSRIPAFASLRSILRSPKKTPQTKTPKQTSSHIPAPVSSQKRVDFTPSVKSRYAVKLAEASPSPAKLDRANRTSEKWEPAIPYDSSAFVVRDSNEWQSDDEENIEEQVAYPSLPALSSRPTSSAGPVNHTFSRYAKDHNRRESAQFKSIFTKCDPSAAKAANSLTSVNTSVNRTNPISNAARVASTTTNNSVSPHRPAASPTVRRVRESEPTPAPQVQPFEDLPIPVMQHGLPGKKRRIEEEHKHRHAHTEEAKENTIPGAWNDSALAESDDEGDKRGGKRARFVGSHMPEKDQQLDTNIRRSLSPVKKPSAAREMAAKNAKDRKSRASAIGAKLTASRLNMLARPKQR